MNLKELAYLMARTDAAMLRQGCTQAARTEVLGVITQTATVDFESAAARSSADSAPAVSQVPEAAGGFRLIQRTPGEGVSQALRSVLERLPHTGDL